MEGGNVGARARGDRREIESAVIRFAGDSGDGMQLTGSQFTQATAIARNDLATFPDFPAEIRAPVGTTFGVSAYQINFGARTIKTAGDELDVLVAMNPAALKTQLKDVKRGGLVIVDVGEFNEKNFRKVNYAANPLEDGTLDGYKSLKIDMSRLTLESVAQFGLGQKDGLRCKNMWALGLIYWMYGRDPQVTIDWLKARFAKNPTRFTGKTVKIEGTVRDVCQGRGCWIEVEADGRPARLGYSTPSGDEAPIFELADFGVARAIDAEQAAEAVRGAIIEGVVPGGGMALWSCRPALQQALAKAANSDERAAYTILIRAMEEPLRTIASNAGYDPGHIIGLVNEAGPDYGFDVRTGQVTHIVEAGLFDPLGRRYERLCREQVRQVG